MFSNRKNVLELLALLSDFGLQDAVLCPGSRNIPLTAGLSAITGINCHAVTDERSAGFFALGVIAATKRPCAVVVTSGSALLNLHPAVAEAHYRGLPLLVISADRPAAWIGQMDGQTLPQSGVFNNLIKHCATACEIKDDSDRWHCNRAINEALLALFTAPAGPVQINVPIGDPFFDFTVPALPVVRRIQRLEIPDLAPLLSAYKRIMLIIGQHESRDLSFQTKDALAGRYLVLAEQLANCQHPAFISAQDAVFSSVKKDDPRLIPDLVITLGGHILSKALKRFVRQHESCHLDICENGQVRDVFCHEQYLLQSDFNQAATALAALPPGNNELKAEYFALQQDLNRIALPYSQLEITREIINALNRGVLPPDSTLHLANSSTVRYVAHFRLTAPVTVLSNRGVNGIEGSLSAAVGAAAATPGLLQLILIGDLSCFYDLNALWQHGVLSNLRIVLFNNAGGEIFAALPGLELTKRAAGFVCAPHQTSALPFARSCGFECYAVTDGQSFEQQFAAFMAPGSQAKFMEINTRQDEDLKALQQLKSHFALNPDC